MNGHHATVRIGTVEEHGSLLQRRAFSLQEIQSDEPKFKDEPFDVNEVVHPSKFLQSNQVHVLIEDETQCNSEAHGSEALGTDLEWQDLDRVGDEEWGVRDIIQSKGDELREEKKIAR